MTNFAMGCCHPLWQIVCVSYNHHINVNFSQSVPCCLPVLQFLSTTAHRPPYCRFIQRAPLAFLQCSVCKPLFCCAIAACSLDHKEASASVMKFLAGFMKSATDKKVCVDEIVFFCHRFRCLPVWLFISSQSYGAYGAEIGMCY